MYHWESAVQLMVKSFDELSRAEKLLYMNYDIHIGAILGIWGKILAFVGSLFCAALPITGFLIWYGRKTKQKDKLLITQGSNLMISKPKNL